MQPNVSDVAKLTRSVNPYTAVTDSGQFPVIVAERWNHLVGYHSALTCDECWQRP